MCWVGFLVFVGVPVVVAIVTSNSLWHIRRGTFDDR